jgi:hypothetical protein
MISAALTNDYVYNQEAAGVMGFADVRLVWQALRRYGEQYAAETGNVVEVVVRKGKRKEVRREELVAFRLWYDTAVRYPSRRPQGSAIRINERKVTPEERARRDRHNRLRQMMIQLTGSTRLEAGD